jgi:diguanylate cyclase (GGDEF)-like protein
MPASSIANASAPQSLARYRWNPGSDHLDWMTLPDDWCDLLPGSLPTRGRDFAALLTGRDQGDRARTTARAGLDEVPVFDRFRLSTPAGPLWVRERLAASGGDGVLEGELSALTEGEAQLAELDGDTSYDLLTGVFTRHRLVHGLRLAADNALSKSNNGAYLVADIDNFGMLNHAYGCRAGDGVLVAVAERLYELLGAGVLVGRVGDDSFGIVLEGADEDSALALAERLVRSLAEQPLVPGDDLMVTISVGAVVFPSAACSPEEAMARADLAVAGAKAAGRNRFELYALSADQRAVQRRDLAIARRVQQALVENRLTFAYQPVVSARSHRPAFFECLLRIRTPNNLVIPAGQFIPLVEDMGLIRQIDHFVLEHAVGELRADPHAVLAINVSAYTTGDAAWLRRL